MKMNHKFIILIAILLFSHLCTTSLSEQTILLSTLLILIAFIKHKIHPIKKELLLFVSIFIGGPIMEIVLVNFSKAWSYSNSQFFGIPIWIAPYWGLMGTTIIAIYEELTKTK